MGGATRKKRLAFVFGVLASFIFFTCRWLTATFGSLEIEQIIWNAANNLTGVDFALVKRLTRYLLKALAVSLAWWFVVYKLEGCVRFVAWSILHPHQFFLLIAQLITSCGRKYKPAVFTWACLSFSFVALLIVVVKTGSALKVGDFVRHMNSTSGEDFITLTYKIPQPKEIVFEKKNNVVLVLAESFERSFFESDKTREPVKSQLLPFAQQASARQNFRMVNAYGSGWTIAAATGWHFGLPLKLPRFVEGNDYVSRRGFLPGAKSVFDVLRENGYETVLVMGSNSEFSGTKTLFSSHGDFKIYDLDYWMQQGWDLKKYQGTGWGFHDQFVLDRAAEVYETLKKKGAPFVLVVETIDTHAKDGWCPESHKKTQDVRDAFSWEDGNLFDFAKRIDARPDNGTVLGIVGDHYFMGNPPFLIPQAERTIFNAFWGSVPEVPELKQRQLFVALDMAPTILQAAGARWSNNQFGLGISLFSSEEGYAQRLGLGRFNNRLAEESALYRRFY